MFKGFYTAASGMLTQQRRTEMLTNNLSNDNTPGFKADQSTVRAFPELLQQRIDPQTAADGTNLKVSKVTTIGSLNTGVYMQETIPNFTQGNLKGTEQRTDIALVNGNVPGDENNKTGSIFFNVANNDGDIRYTRNGDFTLDGQGFLTTSNGNYVLDVENNPIQLTDDQFTVDRYGVLTGSNGETAQLAVSYTDNPQAMVKEGDGFYRAEEGADMQDAYNADGVTFQMQQGFLEGSNVDSARTMTDMMTAYRAFEANQKVLQAYDKSMDKAANDIGRL